MKNTNETLPKIEYKVITDTDQILQIRTERFENLRWSPEESIWKDRIKHNLQEYNKKRKLSFSELCHKKFKHSVFGIFLRPHNENEEQDYYLNENKLQIMKYDECAYPIEKIKHIERKNEFTADLKTLLENAVIEKEIIDYDYLYENIYVLRFCDTRLSFIDRELLKFHRLRVLILCANWITDVSGKCLPRCLEYIELYGNQIVSVHNLVMKPPRKLIYFGLRRNFLTNDSKLHLLATCKRFEYLRSLDLADNDIYKLVAVLEVLNELTNLMSLQLEGNPCSVVDCYKDKVLKYLPWLQLLDCTEFIEKDRELLEKDIKPDAAIVFTCHRIMGLPKPKKEKNIQQFFYFSVSMPLLEEIIEIEKGEEEEDEQQPQEEIVLSIVDLDEEAPPTPPKSPKKKGKKKEKAKAEKSEKSSKKKKGKKEKSKSGKSEKSSVLGLYDGPDEYIEERKQRVVDTSFKTERFEWDKIIQLPEDALIIKSPERNFVDIRDTFRSSVCVKLIYLEVKLPTKDKATGKKKPKGKEKKKKDKDKGKKKKNKSETETEIENENEVIEENQIEDEILEEIINKKITIAEFFCDLHNINWSDKTIDFVWAEALKIKNLGIEVNGNLRNLVYSDKTKPKTKTKTKEKDKKGQKKQKKEKEVFSDVELADDADETNVIEEEPPQEEYAIPKGFTIQIGFGLQRTYYQT